MDVDVPSPSLLKRGKSGVLSTPEKGDVDETPKVSSPVPSAVSSPVVPKRLEDQFAKAPGPSGLVALPKSAPQQMPPPAFPPLLSQGAIDRRIRRTMEPNAKGEYKVSQEVRKLWEEGSRDKVFKLFAEFGGADMAPAEEEEPLPPSAQETMKLLKRLGYPEVQDITKPSALLTKVNTALTKRMGKLEEVKKLFASGSESIAPKPPSAKRAPPVKASSKAAGKAKAKAVAQPEETVSETPTKTPNKRSAAPVPKEPAAKRREESSRRKMLEVLADEIGEGVWRLALIVSPPLTFQTTPFLSG
eukprot:s729_g8.t1